VHYLVTGLARSGTTALFTCLREALPPTTITFFEPRTEDQFAGILSYSGPAHTLTKALIGYITSESGFVRDFFPNILIVRDPRDQIVSELLYRFYDFKLHGDRAGYEKGYAMLEQKVNEPSSISTVDLFNQLGDLVGRPGMELLWRKVAWVVEYREAFQPHVLLYESFVEGKVSELESFLGFKVSTGINVDTEFKRVARTRSHGEWKAWLTDDDLAFVNEHAGYLMEQFGYSLVTRSNVAARLPRATTLDYVDQFRP
jgi:hypothetical protein